MAMKIEKCKMQSEETALVGTSGAQPQFEIFILQFSVFNPERMGRECH
jgi:hypothetical protein